MARFTSRRSYSKTPVQRLPLAALSVKALTNILEKHSAYQVAIEDYSFLENHRVTRNKDERATTTNELQSVQKQASQLSHRITQLAAQLRPFQIGIVGKVLGESGIDYNGKLYRPASSELIQTLTTIYEQYYECDARRQSLEQTLRQPALESATRKPSSIARVRHQFQTFVFDLAKVDVAKIEDYIEQKNSRAILEQEATHDRRRREHQRLEQTKARAAAYDNKQRDLAKSVRTALRKQLHEIPYCPYCGLELSLDNAHADHIYPVAKGGLSTRKNMVFTCATCNTEKRQLTLRAFLKKMGYLEAEVHQRLEALGKDF